MSEKRAGRRFDRDNAVDRSFARHHYLCVAALLVPDVECHGRLDAHEIIPRSAWPDGMYETMNIIPVCRVHHDWIGRHPDEAHELGLHRYSHERTDDGNPEHH